MVKTKQNKLKCFVTYIYNCSKSYVYYFSINAHLFLWSLTKQTACKLIKLISKEQQIILKKQLGRFAFNLYSCFFLIILCLVGNLIVGIFYLQPSRFTRKMLLRCNRKSLKWKSCGCRWWTWVLVRSTRMRRTRPTSPSSTPRQREKLLSPVRNPILNSQFERILYWWFLESAGTSFLKTSKQVIGGSNAELTQFPWQIYLIAGNSWMCGGSLISPKWVLTAAHCVKGFVDSVLIWNSLLIMGAQE